MEPFTVRKAFLLVVYLSHTENCTLVVSLAFMALWSSRIVSKSLLVPKNVFFLFPSLYWPCLHGRYVSIFSVRFKSGLGQSICFMQISLCLFHSAKLHQASLQSVDNKNEFFIRNLFYWASRLLYWDLELGRIVSGLFMLLFEVCLVLHYAWFSQHS